MPSNYYTMPGGFPEASSTALQISGVVETLSEWDRDRQLGVKHIQSIFKSDCLLTMHLLALLELLLVYFTDQSFLKLVVKVLVEQMVYNFDRQETLQLLQAATQSSEFGGTNALDAEAHLLLWQKAILAQIIIVNLLAIIDHVLGYEGTLAPLLGLGSVAEYINADAGSRVEAYSQGMRGFRYGSGFVDFVGELAGGSKFGLIALDLIVPTLQYIMYRTLTTKKPTTGTTESSRLVKPFEDGNQGTVSAFKVDVYPRVTIKKWVKDVKGLV